MLNLQQFTYLHKLVSNVHAYVCRIIIIASNLIFDDKSDLNDEI